METCRRLIATPAAGAHPELYLSGVDDVAQKQEYVLSTKCVPTRLICYIAHHGCIVK